MPGDTGEVGHILVVDDDAMVRQTITNYLEEHDVPAASAPSYGGTKWPRSASPQPREGRVPV
jgi:hypothetical protein